jgi:hypothetical protein
MTTYSIGVDLGQRRDYSAIAVVERVRPGQSGRFDGKLWHVPKLEFLARLQMLLETRRLRILRNLRETGALVRELVHIQSARRPSGRLTIGAEGAPPPVTAPRGSYDPRDVPLPVRHLGFYPRSSAFIGGQ